MLGLARGRQVRARGARGSALRRIVAKIAYLSLFLDIFLGRE
jgi:hypothetical protein